MNLLFLIKISDVTLLRILFTISLWLSVLMLSLSLSFAAVTVTPKEKGFAIDNGDFFKFDLEYPRLYGENQKEICKIIEKNADENSAIIKYEGGAEISFSIADTAIKMKFTGIPKEVKIFQTQMLISFKFSNNGSWKMDADEARPFPAESGTKPQLYQGKARTFTILQFDRGVSLTVPEFSYLELTDNRAWGWKIFLLKISCPYNPSNPVAIIQINSVEGSAPVGAIEKTSAIEVDRFGQNIKREWPDKVKNEAEFATDAIAEKNFYSSFSPPPLDSFGGLPDSGEKIGLSTTGFFHVDKKNGKWFLVDPAGNLFFHLGVCCFSPQTYTYVGGRHQIYEWLPAQGSEFRTAFITESDVDNFSFHEANYIRKFNGPIERSSWTLRMIERVRKWGFNSAGAFTGYNGNAYSQANFPYVLSLPSGVGQGVKMLPGHCRVIDPFEEKTWIILDNLYAKQVATLAHDPLLIGYFLENEPLYEDVPRVVPGLKASQYASKRQLVQFLKSKYKTTESFNSAWRMTVKSFDELLEPGLPVSTASATSDIRDYTEFFFESYYQNIHKLFRKYDEQHMLLGSRLQHGTINNETLCRTMGKYLDVISFNYYTYGVDPDFLGKIYKWTGEKPLLLSEFYWASPKQSGLPGGVRDVATMEERGLAYRNYVEQAATLGYVVGIEWFTLVDQPLTGNWFSKYNGENGNTGLISVTDRPWKSTIIEMAKTNHQIYPLLMGERKPFVYANPRYQMQQSGDKMLKIAKALGPVEINGKTENWPGLPAEALGKKLVHGADSGGIDATFKACWDDINFYIVVTITDPTPMKNENSLQNYWKGDGIELFFSSSATLDEAGALLPTDSQILISGHTANGKTKIYIGNKQVSDEISTIVQPNVDGKSYVIQAAIPFSLLGFTPKEGDVIRFDLGVNDSEDGRQRARQFMWNGTDKNSQERKGWGRATFIR